LWGTGGGPFIPVFVFRLTKSLPPTLPFAQETTFVGQPILLFLFLCFTNCPPSSLGPIWGDSCIPTFFAGGTSFGVAGKNKGPECKPSSGCFGYPHYQPKQKNRFFFSPCPLFPLGFCGRTLSFLGCPPAPQRVPKVPSLFLFESPSFSPLLGSGGTLAPRQKRMSLSGKKNFLFPFRILCLWGGPPSFSWGVILTSNLRSGQTPPFFLFFVQGIGWNPPFFFFLHIRGFFCQKIGKFVPPAPGHLSKGLFLFF